MQNAEKLRALPPPRVALEYYMAGDLYLFDELQTTGTDPKRRPSCKCAPACHQELRVRRSSEFWVMGMLWCLLARQQCRPCSCLGPVAHPSTGCNASYVRQGVLCFKYKVFSLIMMLFHVKLLT